ncbi:unnamed protein product [Choristocarpus tenellus]
MAASDLRVNVESGLRTAMATSLAFLWRAYGPFDGTLTFFAGVTSIVSVGRTAGETIDRSLQLSRGAILGSLSAFFARWLMSYGRMFGAVGFFLGIFFVVRSPLLSSLGKKFGSLAVVILTLTASSGTDAFPGEWTLSALSWIRTHLEGGVFALVASLLPYPRLAMAEGSRRAQYICQVLSAAINACIRGFVDGRDEMSLSQAQLLCEQVRYNLLRLR